ncbi:MAG TPA: lipase family protein [Leptolyngbyaceae cyanobacterium M65_K2018_010]|nr:lipase family protein [Leptolyngbyaceae cyanobacterium M65_K2018_010]
MRLKRRQALWGGLGATVAAVLGRNGLERRATAQRQAQEQAQAEALYDPESLVQAAYQADVDAVQSLATDQTSAQLKPPSVPYNREWSKRLIVAAKLSTLQYFQGKYQADYDGSIGVLPSYPESGFKGFQQVAAFKAPEPAQERIRFEVPLTSLTGDSGDGTTLQNRLDQTRDAIEQQVKQVVQITQEIPVYYGFLLTSADYNLLIFRGTQRTFEIVEDLLAIHKDYINPVSQAPLGKVHGGFYDLYSKRLAATVQQATQSLDPAKPLLISGHSLGGAMANLAAVDLAIHRPELQPNLYLYTYGTPRLGDRAFVEAHSQLIPNHYRVVNLADMIPMTPLSNLLDNEFVHGGEQWSFLSHHGDIAPNHMTDVYRNAIEQEAETKADNLFKNLPMELV